MATRDFPKNSLGPDAKQTPSLKGLQGSELRPGRKKNSLSSPRAPFLAQSRDPAQAPPTCAGSPVTTGCSGWETGWPQCGHAFAMELPFPGNACGKDCVASGLGGQG